MVFRYGYDVLINSGILDSPYYNILIVLIILDFILGTFRSILNKNLNSSIGLKGLIKHTTVIVIVTIICAMFRVSNNIELSVAFIMFYIWEYVLSVIENLSLLSVPFPDWLIDRLADLERKVNKKWFMIIRIKNIMLI